MSILNHLKQNKSALTRTFFMAGSLLSYSYDAHAATAVIDGQNLGKNTTLVNQGVEALEKAQQSIDELSKQNETLGDFSNFTIPYTTWKKFSSEIINGLQCLVPDPARIIGPSFEEADYSLCAADYNYIGNLSLHPDQKLGRTPSEVNEILDSIQDTRLRVIMDASSKGLALSDGVEDQGRELNDFADQLENNNSNAKTEIEQNSIMIQAVIGLMRGQAQTNQILSQLLRVVSGVAISGTPTTSTLAPSIEDDENNHQKWAWEPENQEGNN